MDPDNNGVKASGGDGKAEEGFIWQICIKISQRYGILLTKQVFPTRCPEICYPSCINSNIIPFYLEKKGKRLIYRAFPPPIPINRDVFSNSKILLL